MIVGLVILLVIACAGLWAFFVRKCPYCGSQDVALLPGGFLTCFCNNCRRVY